MQGGGGASWFPKEARARAGERMSLGLYTHTLPVVGAEVGPAAGLSAGAGGWGSPGRG